ncbi:SARP family transcriptional regulator [Wenjunlia tyrosinilytica]|uniref:SARP family transcriptional regulator n=1 Tax=Wenjunlia tyrosinilytica TaxID=1544741 RepID=A0A917ZVF2_9ACTN|nr:SARP family transcriptional regulator [Wenjunlia tyrosinilytica]
MAVDTLIERVWDDRPPPSAVESLRGYVSRLRTRLRSSVGEDRARVDHAARAYRLHVDPDHVDLQRFRRLSVRARTLSRSAENERAVELMHEAEALWRDEPLAEFPGQWATSLRGRLNEELRSLRENRIRLELGLGRHADLIGELQELAARRPVAQSVVADLMLALHRCGRDADALAEYQRARRRLSDELGLDPSRELLTLHQRILRRDPALRVPEPPIADRAGQRSPPPDTMLRDIRGFTGRRVELRVLMAENETDGTALPVTVVHGMAGVGKTTLAVHAAHLLSQRYPDGRFYVHLHGHSQQPPCEPGEALATLLTATGVRAEDLPRTVDERAASWRKRMAHLRVLLVLDDAKDAAQIRPLLPGAPTCSVFVTSRHRLGDLEGARSISLDVPGAAEAAALFANIAGAARVSDRAAVREVVDLCGRHPLAIQLMANSFRHRESWEVSDLVDQLAQATDPLGEMDAPPSILATFDLSYTELGEPERRLFRFLALHPGPDFTLHAAAALVDADIVRVRRGLDELLDCHLLDEHVRHRYRFHDLVREFAVRVGRREDTQASRNEAVRRVLDYYLVVSDRADRLAHPQRRRLDVVPRRPPRFAPSLQGDEGGAWLDMERPNLIAAARTAAAGSPEHACLFPHVLGQSFITWGAWDAAAELHGVALAIRLEGCDSRATAQTLVEHAAALFNQGSHEEALSHAARARDLWREEGDGWGQGEALLVEGRAHLFSGRRTAALRCFALALALHQEVGNRHGEAETLNMQGVALGQAGEYDRAAQRFQAMLAIQRETADRHGQVKALNNIGEIHRLQRRYEEARVWFERSLALVRSIGGRRELANLYSNLGNVCRAAHETDRALSYLHKALDIYRASRDPRCEADCLIDMGRAFGDAGHSREALTYFVEAEGVAGRIGDRYGLHMAQLGTAAVQGATGAHDAAREKYQQALLVAREIDVPLGEAQALDGIARTALATSDPEAARGWWERALAIYERLGVTEAEAVRSMLARLPGPSPERDGR